LALDEKRPVMGEKTFAMVELTEVMEGKKELG
jgi:hypothetical protein